MKSGVAKYLIIGVLIGISIMLLMGAGGGTVGRYQLYTVNHWTVDKDMFYILDTQTGLAKGFLPAPGLVADFYKIPRE
jgi:hypothetical protein